MAEVMSKYEPHTFDTYPGMFGLSHASVPLDCVPNICQPIFFGRRVDHPKLGRRLTQLRHYPRNLSSPLPPTIIFTTSLAEQNNRNVGSEETLWAQPN